MIKLIGFTFLGLFSPGPNVILLTTSGARFGFKRTLPHLLGVALGVGLIAFVTGLGLGLLLDDFPALQWILKIGASAWILWMAWKLWHASPVQVQDTDKPFTLIQAVLFQWVNPKVWAVALSASSLISDIDPIGRAVLLATAFSGINLGVCLFWTYAGSLMKALLSDPSIWRLFIRLMATALIVFSGLVFV